MAGLAVVPTLDFSPELQSSLRATPWRLLPAAGEPSRGPGHSWRSFWAARVAVAGRYDFVRSPSLGRLAVPELGLLQLPVSPSARKPEDAPTSPRAQFRRTLDQSGHSRSQYRSSNQLIGQKPSREFTMKRHPPKTIVRRRSARAVPGSSCVAPAGRVRSGNRHKGGSGRALPAFVRPSGGPAQWRRTRSPRTRLRVCGRKWLFYDQGERSVLYMTPFCGGRLRGTCVLVRAGH